TSSPPFAESVSPGRGKLECRPVQDYRYVIVDVFTDRALAGNQLAVFTDARGLDTETMQALAREINFSESTFVLTAENGGHAKMRIFTPVTELPFAGHPTLGTAFVLGGPCRRTSYASRQGGESSLSGWSEKTAGSSS